MKTKMRKDDCTPLKNSSLGQPKRRPSEMRGQSSIRGRWCHFNEIQPKHPVVPESGTSNRNHCQISRCQFICYACEGIRYQKMKHERGSFLEIFETSTIMLMS